MIKLRWQLEWFEMEHLSFVAIVRRLTAIAKAFENHHGISEEDTWTTEIEGTYGEYVVSRALGIRFQGLCDTFKKPDLPPDLQIRTAMHPKHKLLVRKGDSDEHRFILVTGRGPIFDIRGWLYGHEAKQDQWLNDPHSRGPAYFVPQSALYSMDTLKYDSHQTRRH